MALLWSELRAPHGYGSHVGTTALWPAGDVAVKSIQRPVGPTSRADVDRLNAFHRHSARPALIVNRLGLPA